MSYTEEMIALIDEELKPVIAERDELFSRNEILERYVRLLETAAENVLRAYMPQFPGSRAVDDVLVELAYVTANGMDDCSQSQILCTHGFVLAANICGPCSEGRPNKTTPAQRSGGENG